MSIFPFCGDLQILWLIQTENVAVKFMTSYVPVNAKPAHPSQAYVGHLPAKVST